MSKASLYFKQRIASQLGNLTGQSANSIVSLLKKPKIRAHGHYAVAVPRLLDGGQNAVTFAKELATKLQLHDGIAAVEPIGPFLNFRVNRMDFIRRTMSQVVAEKETYGVDQSHHGEIVIEYSSPNIAKPFHAGHLRGTILGNFLARLYRAKGYKVYELNYLGDWGAQYGLLAVGFKRYGDQELLKKDPIMHLFNIYVKVNKAAEQDDTIKEEAKAYFKRMEDGDEEALRLWSSLRDLSIESYKATYARFPVAFSQYTGESEANLHVEKALNKLRGNVSHLLSTDESGCLQIDLSEWNLNMPKLQRSDGSSLYLLRDVAAGLQRAELYPKMAKSIYVTGIEQSLYIKQVFKTLELVSGETRTEHVPFGRVLGMSTRRGNVVFLEEILDTAKARMLEVMKENPEKWNEVMREGITRDLYDPFARDIVRGHQHLKGEAAIDYIASVAGLSAVIVQDFSAARHKDYSFAWNRMLDSRGDTGVYLQYAHARLCGIERNSPIELPKLQDDGLIPAIHHLKEDSAFDLAFALSEYPDVIDQAMAQSDPQIMVGYLMSIGHYIGVATRELRVKGLTDRADQDQATPEGVERGWLLWSARQVLSSGMKMLGLQPLERM